MKKSSFLKVFLSVLFSFALAVSCDSGGGGGGNSSAQKTETKKTSITVTIPSAPSSDINLLGDLTSAETDVFCYGIWFEGVDVSDKVAEQSAVAGGSVTFDNVSYGTYNFYLKIYIDKRKIAVLNTITIKKKVSESENTVVFGDMKRSDYSHWYFVSTAAELTDAVSKINNGDYSESKKAKICLKNGIEMPNYEALLSEISGKYELEKNGCDLAEKLFSVSISETITGGSVSANPTSAAAGTEITLTAIAGSGYRIGTVSRNGTNVELNADGTGTFTMPSENVTVTAEFERLYTVNIPTDLPDGCLITTDSTDNKYAATDTVTLTVAAAEGWRYKRPRFELSGAPESDVTMPGETAGTYTFSMPTGDVDISATFFDAIYVKADGTGYGFSEEDATFSLAQAATIISDITSEPADDNTEWKIKVVGTLAESQSLSSDNPNINLSGKTLVIEGTGSTPTLNGTGSGTVLDISIGQSVTIKNLKITGGKSSSGSGISISGGADVTLSTGCEVSGNGYPFEEPASSATRGGGVYVYGSKLTVTDNAKIINNNSYAIVGSAIVPNTGDGGGIFATGNSTVVVSGSASISSNGAYQGNGIYLSREQSSGTCPTLEIKETANIQDLYIDSNISSSFPKIKVSEVFTNNVDISMNVALHTNGTQLLDGTTALFSSVCEKFKVLGAYKIGNTGSLTRKTDINEVTQDDIAYLESVSAYPTSGVSFTAPAGNDVAANQLIFFNYSTTYGALQISEMSTQSEGGTTNTSVTLTSRIGTSLNTDTFNAVSNSGGAAMPATIVFDSTNNKFASGLSDIHLRYGTNATSIRYDDNTNTLKFYIPN